MFLLKFAFLSILIGRRYLSSVSILKARMTVAFLLAYWQREAIENVKNRIETLSKVFLSGIVFLQSHPFKVTHSEFYFYQALAVYKNISNLPPSDDAPTDDDTPPSGGSTADKSAEAKEATPVKSKSKVSASSTVTHAGATSLLGAKDDILFSVASSPTRKRNFEVNDYSL